MERSKKMKCGEILKRSKPFVAVILLQLGYAGLDVISKVALNHGMNNLVFLTYRHVVATLFIAPFAIVLENEIRPKMTPLIFIKIILLSLLEPVMDQNLFFIGMKYTSATFAASLYNILPAATFIMAMVFRLERVEWRNIRSQAKVLGTCITVGGAMMMTLVRGPLILRGWSDHASSGHDIQGSNISFHDTMKGAILICVSCFGAASFMILLDNTLKTYPAELSVTAWICLLGTTWNAIIGMIVERKKSSVWSVHFDIQLLVVVYGGVICSSFAYYVQGVVMKERGPVFIAVFTPLSMVFVAVISFFVLNEELDLGRMLGSFVIVAGLYLVVWGKAKDYRRSENPNPTDNEIGSIEQAQVLE